MFKKDNNLIKTILLSVFGVIAVGYVFSFFLMCCNVPKSNEKAIICNTEIGTDSIIARRNMSIRLKTISQNKYNDSLFNHTSEGYGYEYNGEMLRMKFNDNKVIEISYQNNNIDTINLIVNSDEITFNKDKSFLKVCDNFIIKYDGINKFIIKKNYEKSHTH